MTTAVQPGATSGIDRPTAIGLGLIAMYALPLFVPPAAFLAATPPPEAWIGERLFPGTAWWSVLRLLCLAIGAALIAWAPAAEPPLFAAGLDAPPDYPHLSRAWAFAALAIAAVQLVAARFAASFGRSAQIVYLLSLPVPALLIWLGSNRAASARPRGASGGGGWRGIAAVVLAWGVTVVPLEWRSLLAADTVDNWIGLEYLERATDPHFNLLSDGFLPGVPGVYTLLQGVAWFRPAAPVRNFELLQAFHFLWLAVAAVGIGALAATFIDRRAAPIATAAFLFAPFTLLIPLSGSPFFLGPLFGVVLLWLLIGVRFRRSLAALAALGATIGIVLTMPPLLPLAGVIAVVAAALLRRGPRVPRLVLLVGVLSLGAAGLPSIPDLAALKTMVSRYALLRGAWAEMEPVILGQRTPIDVRVLWQAGHPGPLDIPLGSLLSPFAIPRTALRLWGDTYLDPIGAALAACGIAFSLRIARRSWVAAAVLVLLATGMVPGFASSVDRPSHTRMFVAPIALALLSGVGFAVLARLLAPRARGLLAAALSLAIAAGGVALFFAVNRSILPASAVAIMLRALPAQSPPDGALLLDYPSQDFTWLHVARMATYLPERPVPVRQLGAPADAEPLDLSGADVVFWSPALESDRHVAQLVCRLWPSATLVTLTDRAGLSHAFAARRAGSTWRPSLPSAQWGERTCGARVGS